MKKLIYSDYKQQILDAINGKTNLGIMEPTSLIDGFVNLPIQAELSGNYIIGGPSIPMIMLLGTNSGRIYYFALKAILPDLES